MEYKYEDFNKYTLDETLTILKEEVNKKGISDNGLIADIEDELKNQDESVAKCNELIKEVVDLLNEPKGIKCPICGEEHLFHQEYNGTHIYVCEDCPFVGFELVDFKNQDDMIEWLKKEDREKINNEKEIENKAIELYRAIPNKKVENKLGYILGLDLPLWKLQETFEDTLISRTNTAKYDNITIKELLQLGFNNNYLQTSFYGEVELGYINENWELETKLNDKQLNVRIKMIEDFNETQDGDGYEIAKVICVNKDDEKLFI